MHFLDAWLDLSGFEIGRLIALLAVCGMPVFLPGPRPASLAALILAALAPLALLTRAPLPLALGWGLLWLVAGLRLRRGSAARSDAQPALGVESALVALGLGLALAALLVAGVARQDLSAPATRLTTTGAVLIGLGTLHLMLRRHAVRAAFGVATLALGVQLLEIAARAAQPAGDSRPHGAVLLGAALAVALMLRVGEFRARHGGSPWVSDAHMLHD